MFGNKVGHLGRVGSLTLAQRVSAMFSRGEPGAWYDPSDLSTLFQDSAGTVPVTAVEQPVGLMLDKSGRGNHATQATTTKRPVYSRRVNAQIYSEDFTNAAFRKLSVTVTANQAVAPDGTLTANLVEGLNSGESRIDSYPTYYGSGLNEQRTISVYVKKGTASTVRLDLMVLSYATLNLDTGVVSGVVDATASAEALSDGWFRFSLSFMKTNQYHWASLVIDGSVATAGSIYLWGWQEEPGLVATRYQRVNTATDYDTDPSKFPAYLRFDGVDDAMHTGNIDFTATDKMTVVAGVRSNLNGYSNILELGPNSASENGFSLQRGFAANGDYAGIVYGTSSGYGFTSDFAAPDTSVIAAQYDIAQASVWGGEISFRRNGVVSAKADSQGSAGTGNFSQKPLYIGSRAGTSLPFNGHLYSLIVRGAQTPLSQIEATERYIKQKMRLP